MTDEELIALVARGFAEDFKDARETVRRTANEWREVEHKQAESRRRQAANLIDAGYTAASLTAAGRPDCAALITEYYHAKPKRKERCCLNMRDDAIAHMVGWLAAVYGRKTTRNPQHRDSRSAPNESACSIIAKALNMGEHAVEEIWRKSHWKKAKAHWKYIRNSS